MGNIIGGITNALFGKGGAGVAGEAVARARALGKDAVFKPFTVTTASGTAGYGGDGDYSSTLSAPYSEVLRNALAGATGMFEQAASFDPNVRAAEIFREQSALLQPEFAKQRQKLQSDVFGSGRLGLKLAGEAVGAGEGSGMVSPDAYGLMRAQSQTLAQLAPMARQQAYGEQTTLAQLAANMLNSGLSVSQLEQNLLGLGVNAETARAAAAYASGQMQLDPYKTQASMLQQQRGQNAGFFGSVIGGALSGGLFSQPSGQLDFGSSYSAALQNPNYWKWQMPGGGYSY